MLIPRHRFEEEEPRKPKEPQKVQDLEAAQDNFAKAWVKLQTIKVQSDQTRTDVKGLKKQVL